MDLTDNKTFQIFFLLCLGASVIVTYTLWIVLKRKGVDVYLKKNMMLIGIVGAFIVSLPLWLHPSLSIQFKIGLFLIALVVGIANFYAVHYGGKEFRKQFGIENEEDRREKERMKENHD